MSKYSFPQHPIFLKKVSQCRKKLKGGRILWDFSTSILFQNSKKIKGDPLNEKNSKKSRTMPKKLKWGTLQCRPILHDTRKKGKTFLVIPWSNKYNIKFCRTFGRTILVFEVYQKKTLTKSHDYSRLFSRKAPLKKEGNACESNFMISDLDLMLACGMYKKIEAESKFLY